METDQLFFGMQIIENDKLPIDVLLFEPERRDGETDEELLKRCTVIKNIGLLE